MGTYTVYRHLFPNGKNYVGITSRNVKERWGKDGVGYKNQLVYKAIEFYGWDNVEHLIEATGLTEEEAIKKETELIEYYHSWIYDIDSKGYNVSLGGDLGNIHEEQPEKKSFFNTFRSEWIELGLTQSEYLFLCWCYAHSNREDYLFNKGWAQTAAASQLKVSCKTISRSIKTLINRRILIVDSSQCAYRICRPSGADIIENKLLLSDLLSQDFNDKFLTVRLYELLQTCKQDMDSCNWTVWDLERALNLKSSYKSHIELIEILDLFNDWNLLTLSSRYNGSSNNPYLEYKIIDIKTSIEE